MQVLIPPDRVNLGKDLVPEVLFAGAEDIVMQLGAAHRAVAGGAAQNFGLWHGVRQKVVAELKRRFREAGLSAPPLVEDELWASIDQIVPGGDALAHVNLVRALMTNYHDRFFDHLRYRQNKDGNVHLDFCGPTGMGKSSCALALANWIKPIDPARLVQNHLCIDPSDVAKKLPHLEPGDTVHLDEVLKGSGEGSTTAANLVDNQKDTLRKSRINVFTATPHARLGGVNQAVLKVIFWDPSKKYSLFLVQGGEQYLGVIGIPWCPPTLYAPYGVWKDENTARFQAGQFSSSRHLAEFAVSVFADDRLTNFLMQGPAKLKRNDFKVALQMYQPQMRSKSQTDQVVTFMHDLCYNWDRLSPGFVADFGCEPNDNIKRVAAKCYKEN